MSSMREARLVADRLVTGEWQSTSALWEQARGQATWSTFTRALREMVAERTLERRQGHKAQAVFYRRAEVPEGGIVLQLQCCLMLNPNDFRLSHSGALGSYDDCEEYQVDQIIIWVMIPERSSRSVWLKEGDALFGPAWSAIPDVLTLAQQASRQSIPEFWRVHDVMQTAEDVMSVWGIWINPDARTVTYQVGGNFKFDVEALELSEDDQVMVERSADGHLTFLPSG